MTTYSELVERSKDIQDSDIDNDVLFSSLNMQSPEVSKEILMILLAFLDEEGKDVKSLIKAAKTSLEFLQTTKAKIGASFFLDDLPPKCRHILWAYISR